jgi:hypothetical protein
VWAVVSSRSDLFTRSLSAVQPLDPNPACAQAFVEIDGRAIIVLLLLIISHDGRQLLEARVCIPSTGCIKLLRSEIKEYGNRQKNPLTRTAEDLDAGDAARLVRLSELFSTPTRRTLIIYLSAALIIHDWVAFLQAWMPNRGV